MLERFRTVNPIFWSDETHFHLNGHVNKQNCRYWSPRTRNPRLKHQKSSHCPRVTVWCALSTHEIIGPFFFENSRGRAMNVMVKIIDAWLRNSFCQTYELIHRTLHTSGFNRMGRLHTQPELRWICFGKISRKNWSVALGTSHGHRGRPITVYSWLGRYLVQTICSKSLDICLPHNYNLKLQKPHVKFSRHLNWNTKRNSQFIVDLLRCEFEREYLQRAHNSAQ